jgi:NitT/TauT family transport system substrate-binding protein
MPKQGWLSALVLAAVTTAAASPSSADDSFKVAIGQLEIWSGQAPVLGQKAGIFKKYGIALENFGTAGAGETVQAVISGSADFGVNVGLSGVMRAFAKGAPIRVSEQISPERAISSSMCARIRRSRV